MNSFIETLNQLGGPAWDFAGAMLWQSSLLIVLILALDHLFARRIRAAVRYAFWLVVLVKLLLPPALALPTGAAWWLRTVKVETPAIRHYSVTYDSAPVTTDLALPPMALPPPVRPELSGAGWLLLIGGTVSTVLFVWLLFRWWQVTQIVRRATEMSGQELNCALIAARRQAGLRWPVRLKLVDGRMSPAVCGLFRPVILLPRQLVTELSTGQLRAVLLHELIHLRRADVWVNCAQALLQIFYWWHPLVWLANARIRRVREEAVDDAVMLTLREEADGYAPTLLEVAKMTFRRPLMSLGLVGIMESPSALRQRVERLVNFRAPRRAGLTLISLAGLLAFSAVALPMGEAPLPSASSSAPSPVDLGAAPSSENRISTITSTISPITNLPPVLVVAQIYQVSPADDEKLVSLLKGSEFQGGDPAWLGLSSQHPQLTTTIQSLGLKPMQRPRIQTFSGMPAEMYMGTETNGIDFSCTPVVSQGRIHLPFVITITGSGAGLSSSNQFQYDATLENGGDLVFRARDDASGSNWVFVVNARIADGRAKGFTQSLNKVITRLDPNTGEPITNTTIQSLVTKISDDGNTVSSPKNSSPSEFFLRSFKLTDSILANLQPVAGWKTSKPSSAEVSEAFRKLFTQVGLNLESPKGKSVFYNARLGLLFLKATESDLDIAERVIQAYNQPATSADYEYLPLGGETNSSLPPGAVRGTLANTSFQTALQHLKLSPAQVLSLSNATREKIVSSGHAVNMPGVDRISEPLRAGSSLPQVHIKARFLEVPPESLAKFNEIARPSGQTNLFTGILTNQGFLSMLHDLRTRPGVETLAEPEGVTRSGQQMQMRATELITVVTNFALTQATTNATGEKQLASISPQTSQVETGPILDTVAKVLPDGDTLNLTADASVTDFLGYGAPPDEKGVYAKAADSSDTIGIPMILPRFKIQQVTTSLDIKDGQTLVMVGFSVSDVQDMADKVPVLGDVPWLGHLFKSHSQTVVKKDLLVFITVTLVDSAGRRIHSGADQPLAQTAVPRS